jgi:hypothetical protein
MQPETAAHRPRGLTVVAFVAIAAGLLGIPGYIDLLRSHLGALADGVTPADASAALLDLLGACGLILSALHIVFGLGALFVWPWARPFGIALESVSAVVAAARLLTGGNPFIYLLVLAMVLSILFYLLSAEARQAFEAASLRTGAKWRRRAYPPHEGRPIHRS